MTNLKNPYDPRTDLREDSKLWGELLTRFWKGKKELYNTFFVLRGGGSRLKLTDDKLDFTFGNEFNDDIIKLAKKKYLSPHKDYIKLVMSIMGGDLSKKKNKTVNLEDIPF